MRRNVVIFFLGTMAFVAGCGSNQSVSKGKGPTTEVQVQITKTSSYCGGARPSDEMVKDLETPKPASEVRFFIGSGGVNQGKEFVLEGKTDKHGHAVVKLPAGQYYLVFEDKTLDSKNNLLKTYGNETRHYSAIDKSCLEDWFKQPESSFSVERRPLVIEVNQHIPCSWQAVPCADYHGPLPP